VAKNTRGVKEYTREQRLIKQNKQLKQEVAYLRKQITKDLGRIETMREMCSDIGEKERFKENANIVGSDLEDLKKEWSCRECTGGILEITLYSKLGQTFYFRACNNCENRTKGQRYDADSVRGIMVGSQKKS
jgi:hypothetical protein